MRLVLILVLLLPVAVRATVVERLTLEELVDRSPIVTHARAVRTWAAWDPQTGAIWTHTELLVIEGLKGGAARSVIVSEPGGVVGEVGMAVEGVPRYRPGEEVVAFLYRTPLGLIRTRGLAQGKFTVVGDRIRVNAHGAALIASGAASPGLRHEQLDRLPRDQFLGLVRGLLQRPAPGGRR